MVRVFLERVLLPELRRTGPDALLVMANLSAPKPRAGRDLRERSGVGDRSRPPSSPDLDPIALAWAGVKARLRTAAARSAEALHEALGAALDAVTPPGHAQGYFRHAGCAAV